MSVNDDLKCLLAMVIRRNLSERDIETLDSQAQEKGMSLAQYLESLFDM
ncbi:hypothetical protein [Alteromonas sp. a30]|nr:hypothetical protein [Alteromonas sp. a30]MCY7293809.1 hypothetical protein [Alteromonas sp. a30]